MRVIERPAASPSAFAQAVVAALDGRLITGDAASAIRVYGVHVEADGIWVQIGRDGDHQNGVVLHLSGEATVEDALGALQECDPDHWSGVIQVTPRRANRDSI